MGPVKQLLLNCFLMPGYPRLLKYVQRDCATIFMLHRARDESRGVNGYNISYLRDVLAYLTSNGYELVSLAELFERLDGRGSQVRGAVAFTIDDGYVDQATVAAPVFSEFDCPVTTFVSTGFLDGQTWFWWDQIEYVFEHSKQQSVQVPLGEKTLDYTWENEEQRFHAQSKLTAECKRVTQTEKLAIIERLARACGVQIPQVAPRKYAPMSWDQLRECEAMGMSFGPHTVTHPVLSRTTSEVAEHEIRESWARLRTEAHNPVPIFCYPNGEWADFGEREIGILHRLGFLGAVVAEPGYANALAFRAGEDARFKVRRFALPDDFPHIIQYVSGTERMKQLLRKSA